MVLYQQHLKALVPSHAKHSPQRTGWLGDPQPQSQPTTAISLPRPDQTNLQSRLPAGPLPMQGNKNHRIFRHLTKGRWKKNSKTKTTAATPQKIFCKIISISTFENM
jgi:hypothetical protein